LMESFYESFWELRVNNNCYDYAPNVESNRILILHSPLTPQQLVTVASAHYFLSNFFV
jgi:hypothetical protein